MKDRNTRETDDQDGLFFVALLADACERAGRALQRKLRFNKFFALPTAKNGFDRGSHARGFDVTEYGQDSIVWHSDIFVEVAQRSRTDHWDALLGAMHIQSVTVIA